MGANLVGFVVGMDGTQYFAHQLVNSWSGESLPPDSAFSLSKYRRTRAGIRFLFAACACLFVGVQLMFEYRCVWFVYARGLPLIALTDQGGRVTSWNTTSMLTC